MSADEEAIRYEMTERAYHEAGHAVVGCACGLPPECVHLDAGECLLAGPDEYSTEEEVAAHGVQLLLCRMKPWWVARLAGMEAHRKYLQRTCQEVYEDELGEVAAWDIACIDADCHRLRNRGATEGEGDQLRREALAEAKSAAETNWAAIQDVAQALLERGRLCADEVRAILDGGDHARQR